MIVVAPTGQEPLYGFLLFQYFSVPKKTADLQTATLEFNKYTIENVPPQPKPKTKNFLKHLLVLNCVQKSSLD